MQQQPSKSRDELSTDTARELSTTLASQRARRKFDGRSNLLGVDEGGFEF